MEYLVTMTTHVPDGTSDDAVADMRAREAEHSRELAAQGHLLRLWRPPLMPGEWRSLGLFAADDAGRLEDVLASMPLRVWRSDDVTPLSPHPNDPGNQAGHSLPEFLTAFSTEIPPGTPGAAVEEVEASEAASARELAAKGNLRRLWATPGERHVLGLWQAADAAEMQAIVTSLPLDAWMTTEITPLTEHPSDPAILASAG